MAIGYDDDRAAIVIVPDECPDCGYPRYDTGCDAPGCHGAAFMCCGTGCDNGLIPGGRCETALAEEDGDDRAERIDRERAAFGLPTLADERDGDETDA